MMPVDPDVFLQLHHDVVVRAGLHGLFPRPAGPSGSPTGSVMSIEPSMLCSSVAGIPLYQTRRGLVNENTSCSSEEKAIAKTSGRHNKPENKVSHRLGTRAL